MARQHDVQCRRYFITARGAENMFKIGSNLEVSPGLNGVYVALKDGGNDIQVPQIGKTVRESADLDVHIKDFFTAW